MKEVCEQAQKSYGYGFSEQADHTKRRFPYAWQEVVGGLAGVSLLLGGIGVFTALATPPSGNQEAISISP
jgi:hypothetical protein